MPDSSALRRTAVAHGAVAWRECGRGEALVLLHGIGSGSGSWAAQLEGFAGRHRVIAWDAPGCGGSDPLPSDRPLADAYAAALAELLRRLDVRRPILVGHSLGAIVAAAAAPAVDAAALVLASPARGYASAPADERQRRWRERVDLVERLGPAGLAAERAAGLCAPHAPAAAVDAVRANMALITRGGYAQAAWMLSHDDLLQRLADAPVPRAVLCGELDRITPPEACAAVARAVGAPFVTLRGVAHACYVEDPAQFDAALRAALEPVAADRSRHG